MNASRGLGWGAWPGGASVGVGVVGVAGEAPESPPTARLICSFCRRRSFRRSLAFRQGGRAGSAPFPVAEEESEKGFCYLCNSESTVCIVIPMP